MQDIIVIEFWLVIAVIVVLVFVGILGKFQFVNFSFKNFMFRAMEKVLMCVGGLAVGTFFVWLVMGW